MVRIKTIKTEPQPLSKTASGGKMIQSKTRQSDIIVLFKLTFTNLQNNYYQAKLHNSNKFYLQNRYNLHIELVLTFINTIVTHRNNIRKSIFRPQ